MKKVFFAFLAIGAMTLASCSNEEMDVKPAGAEGTVTFTASLPASVQSRDYSDGTTAKNLTYAIYEAGQGDAEQTPLITGTATFNNLKATVSTTLATGKTYDILFWAQADGAPYAFDTDKKTVTATYDGITANNESLDAFFWAEKDLTVTGPVSKTITLTRPFAQVNVGTNDFALAEKAGLKVTQSSLSFSTNVANAINLYSGAVSGEAEVTFGLANIPAGETFPVANYNYLAMAYVLVSADKQTLDVTLATDGTPNKPVFASVPVQRNYRTNIYGALLTNPAVFNVEINPDYEKPDFQYEVIAETAEDVADAFNKGMNVTIPADKEIDLTDYIGGSNNLTVKVPTTMTINGTLKADAKGRIDVLSELTVIGSTTTTSRSGETVITGGTIETGDNAYGIFNAKAGSKLIVKNVKFRHTNKLDGSPIGLRDNAEVELFDCVFDSDFGTVAVWPASVNSKLTATNCVFKSTSNSARNGSNWTYCFNMGGPVTAVLNNCTVEGVQGGVATVKGAHVTINGGTYSTHRLEAEPNANNFYALYIAQEATAVVNDGDFYAEGKKCVYNSNNDIPGDPIGFTFLKGGRYADQGHMDANPESIIYPAEGYRWEPIEGDPIYKWTIVEDK